LPADKRPAFSRGKFNGIPTLPAELPAALLGFEIILRNSRHDVRQMVLKLAPDAGLEIAPASKLSKDDGLLDDLAY